MTHDQPPPVDRASGAPDVSGGPRRRREAERARRGSLGRRIACAVGGLLLGLAVAASIHACQRDRRYDVAQHEAPPVVAPADAARPDLYTEVRLSQREGPWVLRAFASAEGHDALPEARSGDWRAGPGRSERLQTFPAYRASNPVRADEELTAIVIQPLGELDERSRLIIERMAEYARRFFVCPVEVKDAVPLPAERRRARTWGDRRWTQHHAGTIMDQVLQPRLPEHAICYLGVTMEDLYPDDAWNYVFGQAYLYRRVGVYSLARYRPSFWGEADTPTRRQLELMRSCKVLAHETGHMFGIEHCLSFLCTMNGSNNMEETDRAPSWLCPVCSSKLAWNRGYDPVKRYRGLAAFFRDNGFDAEADWYEAAAARVEQVGEAGR